ncbi:MAG: beta-propeller fold lactonase family protein, partial [Pseudomonadota bacterium]
SLADHSIVQFVRNPRLGLDDDSAGQHLQFQAVYVDGVNGVQGLTEPRRILISPDNETVYVTSEVANTVAAFDRDADPDSPTYGDLSFIAVYEQGVAGVDGIAGAQGMVMDAGSQDLYVAGSFGASIARFERDEVTGALTFAERVVNGLDGVSGLGGIRSLAITGDGTQLFGVSTQANAVTVFDRETAAGDNAGTLSFVQSFTTDVGSRLFDIAIPAGSAQAADRHLYVVGQNSSSVAVLGRIVDPDSVSFGQVELVQVVQNGVEGINFMNGPTDVSASPDGKRVYVAAEFSDAVLVFDRDLNEGGSRFGQLSLVETRRDGVNGVDGIDQVRALAVSTDSRNVYAAGFGDAAIASFRLGIGSVCTAGGSGNIDDFVDIGVGGTLVYRATGVVRPNAIGTIENTAVIAVPANFEALMPDTGCPLGGDFCATDSTNSVPEGQVTLDKRSEQVSVTAGETARYVITIENSGPSSLINDPPDSLLNLTDALDSNPAFVPGSATWTCEASGSGSIEFNQVWRNFDIDVIGSGPFDQLEGVSDLAIVNRPSATWLAATSVLGNAVSVFSRDAVTGELLMQATLSNGDMSGGQTIDSLAGARSIVASADGQFLYVGSRVSDSITVFELSESATDVPELTFVQVIRGVVGLDQVQHLALAEAADQPQLYAVGSNDDAIAVFSRDMGTGELLFQSSLQQGDGNPAIDGLIDAAYILASPDGQHLYVLSPTQSSIALFDRDAVSGNLTWRQTYDMLDFMVGLNGLSAGAIGLNSDGDGQFLYLAARDDNRLVVLERDLTATATRGALSYSSQVDQGVGGAAGLVGMSRVIVSPDGDHLYVTSQAGSSVAWFTRDQLLGSLNYSGIRSNLGASVEGLEGATGLVIAPDLDQLFVAGTREDAIVLFDRSADSSCAASGTGELNAEPFNIGAGGQVVFTVDVVVAGDATGNDDGLIENTAVLVASRDPDSPSQTSTQTTVISTEADLSISKDDGLSEINGLLGARALTGTEQYLYVAGTDDNGIGIFSRINDPGNPGFGDLTFIEAVQSGDEGIEGLNGVRDILISQDAAHVYTASPVDNTIAVFDRSQATGLLEPIDTEQNGVFGVSGLSGASAIAISPDDAHVYATGEFGNTVAVFERQTMMDQADYGQLTFLQTLQNGVASVNGIGAPVGLAIAPDGLHVYVIGAEDDTIAVFSRNRTAASANFGRLSFEISYTNLVNGVAGLAGVRDLVISQDGQFVYVLGETDGTVAQFARDPSTGELTFIEFKQDGFGSPTTVVGLTGAQSLLIDSANNALFVAGAQAEAIARFDVDPTDGTLDFDALFANGDPAPMGGQVFGLEGVAGLFASADGGQLYAASSGRGAVLTFMRNAVSPALDFQQILIDGLGGIAPGLPVTYTIRVDNLGPSNVTEARVVDQFPDSFESVSWTCSAPTGSFCLSGGTGDIDTPVRLPAGGFVTISATGVVSAGATGRLVNTATVSAEGVTDPDLSNNSATDDDTVLTPAADLIAQVTNNTDTATPGASVAYDVTIINDGFSSVRGVTVEDIFPAALFNTTWSCLATPQAGLLDTPIGSDSSVSPEAIAFSSDGRTAFVVGGDSLEVWQRDPLLGALTGANNGFPQRLEQGVDGVLALAGARDVVVTPDGRFVYVAASDSDAISLFEFDTSTQAWVFVNFWQDGQLGIEGLGGVDRLLLSPEGNRLVAGSSVDGALAVFDINASDGGLTQIDLLLQGVDGIDGLAGVADLTWSADEAYLLTVAPLNQALAAFERNVDGTLTQQLVVLNDELLGGPAENGLQGARSILSLDNELLVAASGADLIARFELDLPEDDQDSLSLSALGVIDSTSLGQPLLSPFDLAYDPDQARLYSANTDQVMLISLLDEAPNVVQSYAASSFVELTGLAGIALGPNLRQLYTLGNESGSELAAWARERGSRCPLGGEGDIGLNTVDIVADGFLQYRVEGQIQANATGTLDYTVTVTNPDEDQELNPVDNSATDSDPLTPAPDLQVTKGVDTDPVVAGLPISWSLSLVNLGVSDAAAAQIVDALGVFPTDPGGIVPDSGSWSCLANEPLADPISFAGPAQFTALGIDGQATTLVAVSPDADALVYFALSGDGTPGAAVSIVDGQIFPVDGGDDLTVTGLDNPQDVVITDDGLHVYVAEA